MAGGVSGCAQQQNNLRKDLSAQNMSGSEIERLGDIYFNQGNLQLALIEYNKYLKLDKKTDKEIKIGVIQTISKDFKVDEASDDYIDARFDTIFTTPTCNTTLNLALGRLHANKAELLLVLERQ